MPILEEIHRELKRINKRLDHMEVMNIKNNLEELSLNETCKLSHIRGDKLKGYVEDGLIEARKVTEKHSKAGYSYKFTLASIHEFQKQDLYNKKITEENRKELNEGIEEMINQNY